jgi:Domain of unknown function (DUF4942)
MFNPDFYPTPKDIIFQMLEGVTIQDKIILEPSAGKGDIIDYLNDNGAEKVLFCEINEDLQAISQHKGKFLKADFLDLESSDISHIDLIVMNPPFSADEKHISHAFNIAPAGCKIIALCNAQTVANAYSQSRKELKNKINLFGTFTNLGSCFQDSERSTNVEIGLIILQKPGAKYSTEFEGFFMDDEQEPEGEGIMSYNIVRDLVNRYVESIKIFDRQLEEAQRMNQLTTGYFSVKIGMNITDSDKPIQRADFKKEMQKSGWHFIFNKMNMQKHTTRGLRDDINTFVETQTNVPFTMKNIYQMLRLVAATTEQRMDKAILEVFDKVTMHHHENRHHVEGWKTNSHYLLNQKFIFPNLCYQDQRWSKGESNIQMNWSSTEIIEDLLKAICFIAGDDYGKFATLRETATYRYLIFADGKFIESTHNYQDFTRIVDRRREKGQQLETQINNHCYGEVFEWAYFTVKCFKKGTIHFEFKDRELWGRFNQRVAKIKGYPLYEKAPDKRTDRQKAKEEAQPRPTASKIKKEPVQRSKEVASFFEEFEFEL